MSVTIQAIRRLLAPRVGSFALVRTTAAGASPEATRWVISTSATAGVGALRSDGADPEQWIDTFIYAADGAQAGAQRKIVTARPSGEGSAGVDIPWAAALATSVNLEHTWPLPSIGYLGRPGLTDFVVRACRDSWAPDLLTLTTVANQTSYSLSTYARWLDRRSRVVALIDPSWQDTYQGRERPLPAEDDPHPAWEVRFDGGTPTLVLHQRPWRTADATAYLRVKRPADTLVTGSESSAGPSADSDTVIAEQQDIMEIAALYAFEYLASASFLEPEERAGYGDQIEAQRARVMRLERYDPRGEAA